MRAYGAASPKPTAPPAATSHPRAVARSAIARSKRDFPIPGPPSITTRRIPLRPGLERSFDRHQLGGTTHERAVGREPVGRPEPSALPDQMRDLYLVELPLHPEHAPVVERERGPGVGDRRAVDEHLARLGALHKPCREIHRVADHRVDAPDPTPHQAREDRPGADADRDPVERIGELHAGRDRAAGILGTGSGRAEGEHRHGPFVASGDLDHLPAEVGHDLHDRSDRSPASPSGSSTICGFGHASEHGRDPAVSVDQGRVAATDPFHDDPMGEPLRLPRTELDRWVRRLRGGRRVRSSAWTVVTPPLGRGPPSPRPRPRRRSRSRPGQGDEAIGSATDVTSTSPLDTPIRTAIANSPTEVVSVPRSRDCSARRSPHSDGEVESVRVGPDRRDGIATEGHDLTIGSADHVDRRLEEAVQRSHEFLGACRAEAPQPLAQRCEPSDVQEQRGTLEPSRSFRARRKAGERRSRRPRWGQRHRGVGPRSSRGRRVPGGREAQETRSSR